MPDINQFSLAGSVVEGQMDMQVPGTVVTAQINSGIADPGLLPGEGVKMVAGNNDGPPLVTRLTAVTDVPVGFVCYNPIFALGRKAGQTVEIAQQNSIMYFKASAAIAQTAGAGTKIEYDYATNTIKTAAGVNPVIGRLYGRGATGAGDFVRVRIQTPDVIA